MGRAAGGGPFGWRLARLAGLLPPRFIRFAFVGLSGVFVDMFLLWALSDAAGWALTPSKIVSCEAAILNNFLWNEVWTFGDVSRLQGDGRARLRRLGTFNAICLAGLVLGVVLLNLQVTLLGLNRYFANGVSVLLVTAWNFGMNKRFSWQARSATVEAPALQRRVVS